MKTSLFTTILLIITVLCCSGVRCDDADQQRKAAQEKSAQIVTDLYITLRNILFPKSPLDSGITSNRFVFMSPGKVLNYWDYYPGPDYEESLLRINTSAPEVEIPPAVMEKWFDVADVMVGGNPFTGGITGKSMAFIYETIISQMEVLGIETKTAGAQSRYNMAHDYLMASVPDPDNLTANVTRLSLYDRYQLSYTNSKLDMEEKIADARRTKGATEYELWFQRNFPSLNSQVEGAYIKWLTFGEKDIVEIYKTYIDTTSAGSELEEARMSLRASGVSSLDRTRTIYPVSFEPGNWYKYLLPKIKGPSRDMLIAQKNMLQSEYDALRSMITFNNQNKDKANSTLNKLEANVDSTTKARKNKTNEALHSMSNCLEENSQNSYNDPKKSSAGDTPPIKKRSSGNNSKSDGCTKFKEANIEAVTATFQQAQAKSDYESAAFLLNSKEKFNGFLGSRMETLNKTIQGIEAQLASLSKPYLGPIADARDFKDLNSMLNETEQNLDDEWLAFEYDSDSSHIDTNQNTDSLNVAASIGVGVPGVLGVQIGAQYGKTSTDLQQALNSASLKVSGEVMRVVIKRPWFKPSLFEDSSLSFMQRDEAEQKNTYVSPGPMSEKSLSDVITNGQNDNLYLLPEYVTSFVLARDVKLEYSGLDASSISHAMQMMAGGSISGSYNMFSLAASVGIGKTKQSVTADRTANGMIINIPGAQIIGYYSDVLPLFPRTQK